MKKIRARLLVLLLAFPLMLAGLPIMAQSADASAAEGFVTTEGSEFMLNGSRFYFAGTNNYYFHYKSQAMVDDVLEDMAAMNLKVIRIWGFMDGPGQEGVTMQPSPGVYDESGFQKLDYAIYKAGQLGIKLVIPFTNNWDDFGGMNQYVEWFNAGSHDAFYTHPGIKQTYKDYIAHMLNRVNTYTGIAYKDDPTIMTWELANEPRAASDKTGDTLVAWADEMSTYVKSIDDKHLVAVGDEGFYNDPSHPSYPYSGYEGVDWLRLISLPNVDYGTYHMYPDHWNTTAEWGTQWIRDHIRDAKAIGKPAVLEEFGYQNQATRLQVYEEWLDTVYEEGGAGSQFWILTGEQDDGSLYPDYDGFRIVYPSDAATLIAEHAAQMNAKSVPIAAPEQPQNVSAAAGHSSVLLDWDPALGAQSYTILRATNQEGPFSTAASGLTDSTYYDSGLTNGMTYYYKVFAVNAIGDGPESAIVSAMPIAQPPGDFVLAAMGGDSKVELSWSDAAGANAYEVMRATSSSGPFESIAADLTDRTYVDENVRNSTAYYYKVTAWNEEGGTDSNVANATPQGLVRVEYRAGDASATDNAMKPRLRLVNTGPTPVNLNDYQIRYWYTKGTSAQSEEFSCEYAVIGCSRINASFHDMPNPSEGADRYVEISFDAGAGALNAGSNTGDIQLRINLTNWANLDETDDYSYLGTQTGYAGNERIGLYRNGTLVAGIEPDSNVEPTVPSVPTGLTATAGDGQVTLNWNAASGAASYTVKRATTSGGPFATVAGGLSGTTYTDTSVTNGTTYYYVVTASNSAGESSSSAQASATPQGGTTQSELVVQYKAADTNAADNQIKPHFNIKNNGSTAVQLSDLKLRYYFSKDGSEAMNAWIDWAQIGSSNISYSFTDTYVELSFAAGAGTIAAGGQTGDIQLRMAKTNWSNFDETNDYSYDSTKTAYADWNRVTLYLNDSLVWGLQP